VVSAKAIIRLVIQAATRADDGMELIRAQKQQIAKHPAQCSESVDTV
jgi:hypothetical protein